MTRIGRMSQPGDHGGGGDLNTEGERPEASSIVMVEVLSFQRWGCGLFSRTLGDYKKINTYI